MVRSDKLIFVPLFMVYARIVISTVLLLLCKMASAQVSAVYTLAPQQFFNHYYLINPANESLENRLHLAAGNRSMVGVFSGIGSSYGNIRYTGYNRARTQANTVGLHISNMRRGEYIQLNKIHFRYALTIALSENTYISAGVSGGLINYRLAASQASAGGSALGPDLAAGIWLLSDKLQAGISMMQLLNTGLQPLNERLELRRYINIVSSYKLAISPASDLKIHGWFRYELYNNRSGFMICPLYSWKEIIELGPGYDIERGMYVYAGLGKISLGQGALQAGASFLLLSSRYLSDLTDSVVELSIVYAINQE